MNRNSIIEESRYEAAQRRQSEIYDRIINEKRKKQEERNSNDSSRSSMMEMMPPPQQTRRQRTGCHDHDKNDSDRVCVGEPIEYCSTSLASRESMNTKQQDYYFCAAAAQDGANTSDETQGGLGAKVMKRIQQEQIELFERIKKENMASESIGNRGPPTEKIELKAPPNTDLGSGFNDIESEQQRRLEEIQKDSDKKKSLNIESPLLISSSPPNHRVKRKSLDRARGFNLERSSSRQRLSIIESTSSSVCVSDYESDFEEELKENDERSKDEANLEDKKTSQRTQLQRLNSFQNAIEQLHSIPSEIDQKNKVLEMAEALRASYATSQMST